MRHFLKTTALIFALTASDAAADPQADADYIVSQALTKEMFQGAIAAQRPLLISAIQNDLRVKGITLPDPDRFFDLFMTEFLDEFTASMQEQSAEIYLRQFSGAELADIAEFYRTPSGQALLTSTPALMMSGAQLGTVAGRRAGLNAGKRLADKIEAEGLIELEDANLMSRLLEALR